MSGLILTLNAGSSSLKFAVFEAAGLKRRIAGQVQGIGAEPSVTARDEAGTELPPFEVSGGAGLTHEAVLERLIPWIDDVIAEGRLFAVGHRIVHGGTQFHQPVILDEAALTALNALCPLAPLHQPHNLAGVRAVTAARPDLVQVACFDTAFHHGHAEVVTRYALPRRWFDEGVRRYGFHGLSYDYIAGRLRELDPALAAGRVVAAHLGAGASLCAMKAGVSLDTTMGFTALEGLVMGTRCGALDPGVVLYLQQQAGLTAKAVEHMLYHQSGLAGVSELSADMRVLLASEDDRARQAVDLFTHRIARETSALMASLEGLDGLVFTAGIGENAPEIRAAVARRLEWLGLILDADANREGRGLISAPSSRIRAWVIKTDEELMIARQTAQLAARPQGANNG